MEDDDQKKQELIEKYIDGSLDSKESAFFVEKMNDDDFSDAVANQVIGLYGKRQLRNQLNEIENQLIRKRKRIIFFSLLVILLLSISGYGYYLYNKPEKNVDTEVLYAAYFNDDELINFSIRGEDSSRQAQHLRQAVEAYKKKEYRQAILLFEKINEKYKIEGVERLYYSLALIKDQQISKGMNLLEIYEPRKGINITVKKLADWYLALFYIKNKELEKAISILTDLQKEYPDFQTNEIKEILEKLEN